MVRWFSIVVIKVQIMNYFMDTIYTVFSKIKDTCACWDASCNLVLKITSEIDLFSYNHSEQAQTLWMGPFLHLFLSNMLDTCSVIFQRQFSSLKVNNRKCFKSLWCLRFS